MTPQPTDMLISVVGAGGLLGRAVVQNAATRVGPAVVALTALPWADIGMTEAAVRRQHETILRALQPRRWLVLWCAGVGRVGSTKAQLADESRLVEVIAADVRRQAESMEVSTTFSLASSAGAIWSGSPLSLITERVAPHPWHDYGHSKLEQEQVVTATVVGSSHIRAVSARISNLYGTPAAGRPPSGLPGHLIANALRRTATSIYVPIDTTRDYIHCADAAALMIDDAEAALHLPGGHTQTLIVASGVSHTIADVAGTLSRVLGRRVALSVGHSHLASQQPRVLAFRSIKRDLAPRSAPLASGLHKTLIASLSAPRAHG